ncbi:MAG: PAS domain S-box protein [Actinomycetales bacterium]|nr:PAS domain S-box protein [Actinomycetales bacterium]
MPDLAARLSASWENYRILADNSTDVVLEADPSTRIIWASPSVVEVLGWRPDELIGRTASDLVHPDDMDVVREHASDMNAVGSPDEVAGAGRRNHLRIATADGGYRWLTYRARPVLDEKGGILRHLLTFKDTSERDAALRALSVLTEANRVIAFAQDEQGLLDAMCESMVTTGQYPLVWFGEPAHDEGRAVIVRAIAGDARAYAEGVSVSWGDGPAGQGPTGRCLRRGETTTVDDVESDARFAPWRERALAHGLHSSIALPVMVAGRLQGALMVYFGQPRGFDAEARRLLETLASDLGLGLERLQSARLLDEQTRRLAESEARYRLLAEHSSDVVLQAPAGGEIEWASESCRAVLGWDPDAIVGKGFELVHPDDVETARSGLRAVSRGLEADGEIRVACADGSIKWMRYRVQRVASPDGDLDVFSLKDIDREVRARQQLDFALGHDPLTGMSARPTMQQRLADILRRLKPRERAAVVCLSIDRLSEINEAYTHSAGDLVLTNLATRLIETIGHPDRVGRGTGVEFLILVPQLAEGEVAAQLSERLLEVVRQPFYLGETRIDASASIGIALGESGDDPERLIRDASAAMGRAKAEGRDRFTFADATLTEQARHRLQVEQRIKLYLEEGRFVAHFQPIVDLATGEV